MTRTADALRSLTLLRRVLAVDAMATGATGVAYLVASGSLGRLFEVNSRLLLVLGGLFAAWGAAVAWLAARAEPSAPAVRVIVLLNFSWVVLTVIALAVGWLDPSPVGTGWVVLKAAIVAGFALLQAWWLRRWLSAR